MRETGIPSGAIRALTAREQRGVAREAPLVGSENAPLTLVIFSDFTAEDAARAAPLAEAIRNLYADRVRLVFRHYPSQKRKDAALLAEASLAAHEQGKFWEYHDVLFANPHERDRSALERYAEVVGLDLGSFRRALDERRFSADVRADRELGAELGLVAVPAVFANGRRVPVPYGAVELARLVATELGSERIAQGQ